jgi:signal transduction histidine kinase
VFRGAARLYRTLERFFRAHAPMDEQLGVSGTGLGLAIVADCTEALGGSIRFESSAGQGTTFYITLPAVTAPEA